MNKNIGTIEGKISKLENRKHDLQAELTELEGAKAELTDRLGSAILAGGNSGKIEADLGAMETRQSGLEAAIGKADHDLGGLGSELEALKLEDARTEIEGVITGVRAEMAAAGVVVLQMQSDCDRWWAELIGAADRASVLNLVTEKGHADYLRGLFPFLHIRNTAGMLNNRLSFTHVKPIDELRQ